MGEYIGMVVKLDDLMLLSSPPQPTTLNLLTYNSQPLDLQLSTFCSFTPHPLIARSSLYHPFAAQFSIPLPVFYFIIFYIPGGCSESLK